MRRGARSSWHLVLAGITAGLIGCADGSDRREMETQAQQMQEPQQTETAEVSEVISPDELAARLSEGTEPVLLDVRSQEEFAAGHIPGAINIPYDELETRLSEIDAHRGDEIVVYCRTGRRAKIAEAALAREGFRFVRDLDGHMTEWTAARKPVSDPTPCC